MLWDTTGISVWFFPRENIPTDITASAPVPANWGLPSAFFSAASCDPFQNFVNQAAIFDTTLCGDWAGAVWSAAGPPGQEQSCAQITGVPTCQQFVMQNGAALSEACKSFLLSSSLSGFTRISLHHGAFRILLTNSIWTDWEVKSVQIYQSS